MDPVALTRALVDFDSTTGREGEVGRWLADHLRDLGFSVTIQPVDDLRFNILATVGSPQDRLLDALRLCAAVFSQPHRGRSALRARIL